MKHILASAILLASLQVQAQDIDRTKAPQPLAAPVINIPDADNFVLPNGLKVFVLRNTKLPQVSATLSINKEAIAEGNKAGVSNITGALMSYGTTKLGKIKLDEEIAFLGGDMNSEALSISASSLSNNFDKLFSLMADVTLRPLFAPADLERVRKQNLSQLQSEKDEPATISKNVTDALLYGKNHPYGEVITEESLQRITLADVKMFYKSYWKPNNAYLVFVGDITLAKAKSLATQYLAAWPKGVITKEIYATVVAPAKTYIAIVDRPSAVQSTIKICTPVELQPGSSDAIPASVMNTILGGGFSSRLMQNLREKHAFTYSAGSSIISNKIIGKFLAGAAVRNEKTDSSIAELLYEINRIAKEPVGDLEIKSIKNYMSGGFARSLESPATIASFALAIARYNLPKDYYRNYLTKLDAVNIEKVQEEAKKFLDKGLLITIVGNAKEIAAGLVKYGEVKYFDIYGNSVVAPVFKKVDASITGEGILKKAIDAYGGQTAINAIKDISYTGKMAMMGQELDLVQKIIVPTCYLMQVKTQGITVMEQLKKGENYSMSQMGQTMPLNDDVKRQMDAQARFIEETYLLSQPQNTFTVKGIEKINGHDAYEVEVKTANGEQTSYYYDVTSGLRVQMKKVATTNDMGKLIVTINYLEYKEYNGVKVPVKIAIDQGAMKPEITIADVKINQNLQEADLK